MMNRLSVAEAARLMEVSPQAVRLGLRTGQLPFGCALKTSGVYTYYISPAKFEEYTGIKIGEGYAKIKTVGGSDVRDQSGSRG